MWEIYRVIVIGDGVEKLIEEKFENDCVNKIVYRQIKCSKLVSNSWKKKIKRFKTPSF